MALRMSEADSASLCRERVDERQRRLAFGEVIADLLAEFVGFAAVVERVVDELEGEPEPLAVRASALRRRPARSARIAAICAPASNSRAVLR